MKGRTDYWQINTPAKVGPGSYNLSSNPISYQSVVPFAHSSQRSLTIPHNANNPGPGAYENQPLSKHAGNFVKHMSPRFVAQYSDGPGPGAYNLDQSQVKKSPPILKSQSIPIKPSSISIPSKRYLPSEISPVSYSPEFIATKPSVPSTKFSKPRKLKPLSLDSVGPGSYFPESISGHSPKYWVFSSKVQRFSRNLSEIPGPGYYDSNSYRLRHRLQFDAFGSCTERTIPLSTDPHRPYGYKPHRVPEAGRYFLNDSQHRYKEKYKTQGKPMLGRVLSKKPIEITEEKQEAFREVINMT